MPSHPLEFRNNKALNYQGQTLHDNIEDALVESYTHIFTQQPQIRQALDVFRFIDLLAGDVFRMRNEDGKLYTVMEQHKVNIWLYQLFMKMLAWPPGLHILVPYLRQSLLYFFPIEENKTKLSVYDNLLAIKYSEPPLKCIDGFVVPLFEFQFGFFNQLLQEYVSINGLTEIREPGILWNMFSSKTRIQPAAMEMSFSSKLEMEALPSDDAGSSGNLHTSGNTITEYREGNRNYYRPDIFSSQQRTYQHGIENQSASSSLVAPQTFRKQNLRSTMGASQSIINASHVQTSNCEFEVLSIFNQMRVDSQLGV